jgi:hypothetical protein
MNEEVVTQLGLLLTQVRYARMALENIERATSRYAGLALTASAGGGGTPFGSPPLLDGALKVYVVNINDLTSSGGGLGDIISGVLGGAGRFLGGVFGGLVGGTVSGVVFPYTMAQIASVVEGIERIVNRLGLGGGSSGAGASGGGPSLLSQLGSLAETFRAAAALFNTAAPAGAVPQQPAAGTPAAGFLDLTRALGHVVNGLILLVPLLIGALASFLIRLDDIKLAIVDMLQFAVRNLLLARAVVLAIVLDTISLAARLAGSIVGIIATLIDTLLESVFRVVNAGLETVLTALRIASTGLKTTVDALMLFLRDGVGALLIALGRLQIFRLVFHLAAILPLILPAIARIVDKPLNPAETAALTRAAGIAPPTAAGPGGPVPIANFPDLAATIIPASERAALVGSVADLGRTLRAETGTSFGAVRTALGAVGTTVREAAGNLDRGLGDELRERLGAASVHARSLAESMQAAEAVSLNRPQTGLEAIAGAYEGWLRGGGLTTLMQGITAHFQSTPTDATGVGRTIPGRVISGIPGPGDTRVTVEIGEVLIDLAAPAGEPDGVRPTSATPAFDGEGYLAWLENFSDRAGFVPA